MAHMNSDLAKILRLLAEIAESDKPELFRFILNSAKTIKSNHDKQGNLSLNKSSPASAVTEGDVLRLEEFEDRESLAVYLRQTYARKVDLEAVARKIKISETKTMGYDDLIEKVIDASIGYKIRSRAIRGE